MKSKSIDTPPCVCTLSHIVEILFSGQVAVGFNATRFQVNGSWVCEGKLEGVPVRVEDDSIAVPAWTQGERLSPMLNFDISKEDAILILHFDFAFRIGHPNFTTNVCAQGCHESYVGVVGVCVRWARMVLQGLGSQNLNLTEQMQLSPHVLTLPSYMSLSSTQLDLDPCGNHITQKT